MKSRWARVGLCGLWLGGAALAQTPPAPADAPTIVVTAAPLETLKQQLEDCLRAGCSVQDDINKSLAYAEGLFVDGDYRAARSVVRASLGRNSQAAAEAPALVSMLYRASARLSVQLGDENRFRIDTQQIVRALNDAPERDLAEILLSELEVAAMALKTGDARLAEQKTDKVLREARAAKLKPIENLALLRRAMLPALIRADRGLSIRRLQPLTELDGDEASASLRIVAKVLMAQLKARPGQAPDLTAELRNDAALPLRQALIWTPLAENDQQFADQLGTRNAAVANVQDRWADVSFRVMPDGRVRDVQVLRQNGPGDWVKTSVKQVQGRIYTPLPPSALAGRVDGEERVERHTLTAFKVTRAGSLIARQTDRVRVEIVDLTVPDDARP